MLNAPQKYTIRIGLAGLHRAGECSILTGVTRLFKPKE
jgi:hypothetical protein